MCGIVGMVAKKPIVKMLVDSLSLLEYRGYDSAGIAVTAPDGGIIVEKVLGKIENLRRSIKTSGTEGKSGIAHTRWATHGKPSVENAHPFSVDGIALVHNGIVENYASIKKFLAEEGVEFRSETDTEVLLHLISYHMKRGMSTYQAVNVAFREAEGSFAIAVLIGKSGTIIGARKGAPLAVGVGEDGMYIGSDALALSLMTDKVVYLGDGEVVELTDSAYNITNSNGEPVIRGHTTIALGATSQSLDGYAHYMLKEIHQQPFTTARLFNKFYNNETQEIQFPNVGLEDAEHIYLIGCGTSYHACLVAKYLIESIAGVAVTVDVASEMKYRKTVLRKNSIAMFLSQSGETADTLSTISYFKEHAIKTVAIVNSYHSSMEREADNTIYLECDYEIGVASTKVFTAQLMVVGFIALHLGAMRGMVSKEQIQIHVQSLHGLPDHITRVLQLSDQISMIADSMVKTQSALYIGRGISYPLALEGALKLKEISYIHAEGIASGELKHGVIALITQDLPVVAIAPSDELFSKTFSNIQEIVARKGKVISITDDLGAKGLASISRFIIMLPHIICPIARSIIFSIPLQLLAYYTALKIGTDIDQPRNLAKSVTVE